MADRVKPITIIGASAGTGKTFRLASEFSNSLNKNSGISCPTEIISTTFTNKAADELKHRIRKFLLNDGRWDQAQALFASFIGTVNSVCGRLVSDLAVEAGLSPSLKIIAEEQQNEVFNTAVEEVTNSYASNLWRVIYRLSKEDDWRADVIEIADIARQNNIGPQELIKFGESSWSSLKSLLPSCSGDKTAFLSTLKNELTSVISTLPAPDDSTKMTADVLEMLREIDHTWKAMGDVPWQVLIKLSKLKPAKRSQPFVQKLMQLAREHASLTDFHEDLESFIRGIFCCASDCLKVYEEFKAERGLLDFIDQEQIALSLLQQPHIRHVLENRFSALFIDEFQDTSPIQLAVFLELARMVRHSIWVGDEKQSIFGFRGSDPSLMQQAVSRLVPDTGGTRNNLTRSYRSRPGLVSFVNSVFLEALQPMGIEPESIEIQDVARVDDQSMNTPLHVWWLSGTNQSTSVQALASGIENILLNPQAWLVGNSDGVTTRPIRGSDIAVLCRTNSRRSEIAEALSRLGILVSTERTNLLQAPECVLAIAAVRYLADKYDTLAAAEIVRYTSPGDDGKLWLFDWLDLGSEQVMASNPVLISLDVLRNELLGLTPVEALQLATTAPFVLDKILKWGNQRQRSLNLEALLGIAESYQQFCSTNRQTASIAGLITFLKFNPQEALQPANPDDQAVQVLTYHKAKGLEWPMVIMYDLDSPPAATAFGAHVHKAAGTFDPHNPLTGRTIRYWPWPYGLQRANIDLATTTMGSKEMAEAVSQRHAENLRLLYVGMTRPRDYLVLACRETNSGTDWLQIATNKLGNSVFQLSPDNLGKQNILRHATEVSAQCSQITAPAQPSGLTLSSESSRFEYITRQAEPNVHLSYSCTPSALRLSDETPADSIRIDKKISLGGRLNLLEGTDMRSLGEALHLFLAVDDHDAEANQRVRLANEIAAAYNVKGLQSDQFLEASRRLKGKLDELYPDANWLREWPVTGRRNAQRISGAIDLLLELSEGYVIIDHKSFPGGMESWEDRALSHYPQLDAYADLVRQATSRDVIASYIHMPIIGSLLSLKPVKKWTSDQSSPATEDNWLVF